MIITSFLLSFFEYIDDRKFGALRIINIILQLIILTIYILRFDKFIKVKQFLLDNRDIYESDSYFPNKVFNIDSFPLALSTIIFIINILYIIYPNHELCLKIPQFEFPFSYESSITIIITFFILSKITFEIFDLVNDSKIIRTYNNLLYNWEISPIKSIEFSNIENEESDNIWKWDRIKIERLDNFNYINIYSSSNSKLCGKDNFGNNLYFPEDVDCPINEIFILPSNEYLPSYTKLKLNDSYYLYYTNQSTEGKILIDLISSYDTEIPLNPDDDYDSNYFSKPFYEELDFDIKYIYSVYY